LDTFGDGVWFVDLAAIVEPGLVAASVAKVVWVTEEPGRPLIDSMVEQLIDRHLLVVLDNCEQVIAAAAAVVEALMTRSRRVSFLATSREPLGISGEQVYRVPSLTLPDAGDDDPAVLAQSEAVALFVERAAQHKPGFTLTGDNAQLVGRVCRRLDGIPFAIELAAARLRSMSITDLDRHLDQRFRLLTGGARTALPRQQTLLALIDFSYDLLSAAEQAVLARLSIFAGGFDLLAAEGVCTDDELDEFEIVGVVDALVDKSLVQADDRGDTLRYRLLETMREYAKQRLADRGDVERARVARLHRNFYLALALEAQPHLRGPGEVEWAERLEVDLDNLRAALDECLADPDPKPGLRLAASLFELWVRCGSIIEGAEALQAQLARPEAKAPTALRARALAATGLLLQRNGDFVTAATLADEALAIGRHEGDDFAASRAFVVMAFIRLRLGDYRGCKEVVAEALPIARRLANPRPAGNLLRLRGAATAELGEDGGADLHEAADLFRRAGDRWGVADTLSNAGKVALVAGDVGAARGHLVEALAIFRALRNYGGVAVITQYVGVVAYLDGEHAAAYKLFRESLQVSRRIGDRPTAAYALLHLAMIATERGDAGRAATLHGASDELLDRLGVAPEILETRLRSADHARLRTELGDIAFDTAYHAGRVLPVADAASLATQSE
jgi:non-specific serine/threonine protein kinase